MQDKSSFRSFISAWFTRNFSSPQLLSLLGLLVFIIVLFALFGQWLKPIFFSIAFAYVLLAGVHGLERLGMKRILAVWILYLFFLALIVLFFFFVVPALWRELANLSRQLPILVANGAAFFNNLKSNYPNLLTSVQTDNLMTTMQGQISHWGQWIFSYSITSITGLIEFVLYVVLVPVLVFFFMKDHRVITNWISNWVPKNRESIDNVWANVHRQIGNYVRGRVTEVIVVGIVSVITFSLLGLDYALLLGALVGVSAIVPYIGAVVVTIPIVAIAFFQWGVSADFVYLIIAYAIIIILDANVLVPWLFSETLDLHPVVIIVAVLLFGGLWGFWGVFFAIPLATVLKAVMDVWPRQALK